jgi:hypothetical protein
VVRVRDFLTKKYIKKIYHLPYSSDLAPWNIWLFSKLQNALKG